MLENLLLIGGGGHCRVVIEALRSISGLSVAGIIDVKERVGTKVDGIPIIGTDSDLEAFFKKGYDKCFIAIGSVGDSAQRERLYTRVKSIGYILPNIVHPNAMIAAEVQFEGASFIAQGAILGTGVKIGNNCIINTGAIVDHDCIIDDTVHVSPGSVLCGGVKINRCSHIGAGATVLQSLSIGKNTIIGAGSVVTKNMPDSVVAYGNPCVVQRINE